MYAYAHATLDKETIKVPVFLSRAKLFAFIEKFYDLKDLPNCFAQQMFFIVKDLIHQKSAMTFFGDILLKSNSQPEMLQLLKQIRNIASKKN